MSRIKAVQGLGVLAMLVVACAGSTGAGGGAASTSTSSSATGAGTGGAATDGGATKEPLCGLVTMGSLTFYGQGKPPTNNFEEANAHPDLYVGVVILATWAELEPTEGTFDFSSIDAAIQNIEAYNGMHPTHPVVGKLRVFAGTAAPTWAQALDNGPLVVTDSSNTYTLGHFWSSAYQGAWRALQVQLAATYDTNPLVGEVAVSSCATLTAEPFVYPSGPEAAKTFLAAGFTDAQMQGCLSGALDDYAAWKLTPIDYTFNRYEQLDSGTGVPDAAFETSLMATFRSRYGKRAVLANHGLQDPIPSGAAAVYAELLKLGPSIEFQTVSPTINLVQAFDLGLSTYHATELENWDTVAAGGTANLDTADLQALAAQFVCP